MNNIRFQQLFTLALQAKRSLDKYGSIKRNKLPQITVEEHHELVTKHPKMAAFTRCFEYPDNDYVEDTNRMSSSRLPKITEIWVGARSLGCIAGESAETESEGLSASQLEQEDSACLTDLQTMLYEDAKAFDTWIEERTQLFMRDGLSRTKAASIITQNLPVDKYGNMLKCMTTDEITGEYRPVQNNDVITVVRGSNDDLDALFLEEGDDPRMQNDHGAEGSEHRWSGRFRANTSVEEEFLTNSCKSRSSPLRINEPGYRNILTSESRKVMPNSSDSMEDIKWNPNEFEISRLAEAMVEKVLSSKPEWADRALELTDEAKRRIGSIAKDLSFDNEGAMVQGHFISRDEFFGTIESNQREYASATSHSYEYPEKQIVENGVKRDVKSRKVKTRPLAVDWSMIRSLTQKRKRQKLESSFT